MISSLRSLIAATLVICLWVIIPPDLSQSSIEWTGEYTADAFPDNSDPVWIKVGGDTTCDRSPELIESINDGILNIYRRNEEVFYYLDGGLTAPFTLEFSTKIISNAYSPDIQRVASVYFGGTGIDASVKIYLDKVDIYTSPWVPTSGFTVNVDTTDTFHLYRFTYTYDSVNKGVLSFYLDNQYMGQIRNITRWSSGLVGPWGGYTFGKIVFGEGGVLCWDHSNYSQSEWDFVRYYIGEALPPDADEDDDGIADDLDNCIAEPNADQLDSDNDGLGNVCDGCPFDADNDGDGDGICGDVDNCPSAENAGQEDADNDGVGDICNDADDTDGDEWSNLYDNCDSIPNPDQADSDNDGFGDVCDVCPRNFENDADGDGICELDDNCPVIANPNQSDGDGDGKGDACDEDNDNDGVVDLEDNCPLIYNDSQADYDGDGAGDACDSDNDGDGVLDDLDECLFTPLADVVNITGCSIIELCPCGGNWKNHGAFVKCVTHLSTAFMEEGLITESEKNMIVSDAAQSDCGHKKR